MLLLLDFDWLIDWFFFNYTNEIQDSSFEI